METSSRAVEINVISGEGLRINRRQPVKRNAFAVVRAGPTIDCTTSIDKDGGSYPAWNESFAIDVPMHARFLTLEVQCKTYSGNKLIGSAKIPVSDFTGGYVPENYLHFLSYRLRDVKGERNGIINLSIRVKVDQILDISRVGRNSTTVTTPSFSDFGSKVPNIFSNVAPKSVGYAPNYSRVIVARENGPTTFNYFRPPRVTPAGGESSSCEVVTGIPVWHE